jgi:hypothetical protein
MTDTANRFLRQLDILEGASHDGSRDEASDE